MVSTEFTGRRLCILAMPDALMKSINQSMDRSAGVWNTENQRSRKPACRQTARHRQAESRQYSKHVASQSVSSHALPCK